MWRGWECLRHHWHMVIIIVFEARTEKARTLHALNREPLLEALIMLASFSLFEGGNRENTIAVVG